MSEPTADQIAAAKLASRRGVELPGASAKRPPMPRCGRKRCYADPDPLFRLVGPIDTREGS